MKTKTKLILKKMSLIFISNLNHLLKKIKFVFKFKNKMHIKIFHVAERYHF